LDSSDTVIGTIKNTDIHKHTDSDGTVYYAPVVIIDTPSGTTELIYADALSEYKVRDPKSSTLIPKYKIGDIFYKGTDSLEIIEVISSPDEITYKIKYQDGTEEIIKESDFSKFTLTPSNTTTNNEDDLGENEDEVVYQQNLEGANGSTFAQRFTSDGSINHWVYTFNGTETGVLWDEHDKIRAEHFDTSTQIGQRTASRIDNVNGLLKLYAVSKDSTKAECLIKLANIRSYLMNVTDNDELLRLLNDYLNLGDGYLSTVSYGIKSSAGVS
jgi:hypothetical protein